MESVARTQITLTPFSLSRTALAQQPLIGEDFMTVKSTISMCATLFVCGLIHCAVFAAEIKRPPEWDKLSEAAKKGSKIVIAIPPAVELRKEMEIAIKQKLGLEADLVPTPGPVTRAGSRRSRRPACAILTL